MKHKLLLDTHCNVRKEVGMARKENARPSVNVTTALVLARHS
jgi:hypothetical protein